MSDNEEIEEETVNEESPKNETKRIFINHIDSYHGKNIAKVNYFREKKPTSSVNVISTI
jgi:hypothetical protein